MHSRAMVGEISDVFAMVLDRAVAPEPPGLAHGRAGPMTASGALIGGVSATDVPTSSSAAAAAVSASGLPPVTPVAMPAPAHFTQMATRAAAHAADVATMVSRDIDPEIYIDRHYLSRTMVSAPSGARLVPPALPI